MASQEAYAPHAVGHRGGRPHSIAHAALLALAALLGSCSHAAKEQVARLEQPLSGSPIITGFVLYAERSVKLGDHDTVTGGDVGVAALAPTSFGPQAIVGTHAQVDPARTVFSPSTEIDQHASAGDVQTNTLTNNGGSLIAQTPYPFSLPPLPLAMPSTPAGSDVTVGANKTVTLPPGNYGALSVADHGVVILQAGTVFFSSVSVGEHAQILGDASGVTVQVAGTLTVAGWTTIAPRSGATADKLRIAVAGNDQGSTVPAASLASHDQITALVAAPRGTLSIGDHVQVLGALAAFDIAVSDHVQATFQAGFSATVAYPHGQQRLAGEVPPSIAQGKIPIVGPVPSTFNITLTIGLPLTHQDDLQALIDQLYDPRTPQFHKYLTPAQFAGAFGATQADYDAVVSFARANGLQITNRYDARYLLTVTAPASVIESTFFVTLNLHQRPDGTLFYAPGNDPSTDLSVPIQHISDFDSFAVARPADGTGPNNCGIHPANHNYVGNDLRAAYVPQSCTTLKGENQSVALVEFDSYSINDISDYGAAFGVTVPTLNNVQVPRNAPTFAPGSRTNEVVVDIDMLMDIVPSATVYVYEENIGTSPVIWQSQAVQLLGQIASENLAPVISSSYVWADDVPNASLVNVFQQYAVQGQSFFQASGDKGSYISPTNDSGPGCGSNPNPSYFVPDPIIDSSLMTVVGGTLLSTATALPAPYPTPYYLKEAAYKDLTWSGAAGGGGFVNASDDCASNQTRPPLPIPTYQLNINPGNAEIVGDPSASPPLQGNVSNARMIPDVSIVADEFTYMLSGNPQACEQGTSFSAPLWAGIAVLMNQSSSSGPIGFANPLLYAKAHAGSTAYTSNFNDVDDNSDNNLNNVGSHQYHAVPGYDLATGLGSPKCSLLSALPPQSCMAGSSLSALITGTNVTAFVPTGSWSEAKTGIKVVPIEGAAVSATTIPTAGVVNTCAGNSLTNQVICTANNNDVYIIDGTTLGVSTLTSGADPSSAEHFSGGSCSTCNVAVDPLHNVAYLSIATDAGAAIQPVDLDTHPLDGGPDADAGNSNPTLLPPFPLGQQASAENILVDPIRGPLVLSPHEFGPTGTGAGGYELLSATNGAAFDFNPTNPAGPTRIFDQAAEDCTTGIALATSEFSGQVFLVDLTRATFDSDAGTWQSGTTQFPGFNFQSVPEFTFSNLPFAEPASGPIAVVPNSHIGVVASEFGGAGFGAFVLPSTAGGAPDAAPPALVDWVVAQMPNTPDSPTPLPWKNGADPHNLTAYKSPIPPHKEYAILEDDATQDGTRTWLAIVDLQALLDPNKRKPAGSNTFDESQLQSCQGQLVNGSLPQPGCIVSFIPVPP